MGSRRTRRNPTQAQGEHAHRKPPCRVLNQEPSCCETTVRNVSSNEIIFMSCISSSYLKNLLFFFFSSFLSCQAFPNKGSVLNELISQIQFQLAVSQLNQTFSSFMTLEHELVEMLQSQREITEISVFTVFLGRNGFYNLRTYSENIGKSLKYQQLGLLVFHYMSSSALHTLLIY